MITMLLPCPHCHRTTRTLEYYGNEIAVCEDCGKPVFETEQVDAGQVFNPEFPSETGENFYPRQVVLDLEDRLKKALNQTKGGE